jgi:transposase
MPMKYETETRAKAIRLVIEHSEDYAFEYEAIKTVAGRLGMNP